MQKPLNSIALALLALGCSSPSQGTSPTAANSDAAALIHPWVLKKVSYIDTGKHFVPQSYGGLRLMGGQRAVWSDGCNRILGSYKVLGPEIQVSAGRTTLIGCPGEREDVRYQEVKHYSLQEPVLTLTTPTQIYTLERSPFSALSWNSWSLHSIIDRTNQRSRNLDRFRTVYEHLHLTIKQDSSFVFLDLDRQQLQGSVKVKPGQQLEMRYDDASLQVLKVKKKVYRQLADSENGYKKTSRKYATHYADELRWDQVTGYTIEGGALLFNTPTETYRFVGR